MREVLEGPRNLFIKQAEVVNLVFDEEGSEISRRVGGLRGDWWYFGPRLRSEI